MTDIDPAGVMGRAIVSSADLGGARVLEVGAGDGRLTFEYAAHARAIIGIDTKEIDVQAASQRARPGVQFLCASATALPFSGEQFDIVLLASSL